jgi:hypothetical protein
MDGGTVTELSRANFGYPTFSDDRQGIGDTGPAERTNPNWVVVTEV